VSLILGKKVNEQKSLVHPGNQPLVSIIITSYNYEKFLSRAIDSALQQTYPVKEVIVVDDGSTDNSRDIINSYGDRIVPVFQENGGMTSGIVVQIKSCLNLPGKSRPDIFCLETLWFSIQTHWYCLKRAVGINKASRNTRRKLLAKAKEAQTTQHP
jgi:Glycosyltransferases involved in cell wall biogenesis